MRINCLDVIPVSSDVTPLVLGAVKDSESTGEDFSKLSISDFRSTLLVSRFILNVISLGYKIFFFQLPMLF